MKYNNWRYTTFFFFFFNNKEPNKKLIALREQAGLSRVELAKAVDVHKTTIKRWEKNNHVPKTDSVRKVADYFGLTTDELIKDDVTLDELLKKSKEAMDSRG